MGAIDVIISGSSSRTGLKSRIYTFTDKSLSAFLSTVTLHLPLFTVETP